MFPVRSSLKRQISEDDQQGPAPSSKKTRAASGQVELNYPFWYTIEEPELNPPLLNPNGPLYQEDGMLKLRMTAPVANVRNGVGLKYDGSLSLNQTGEIGLNVTPQAGLETTDNGLGVKVDGTTIRFTSTGAISAVASEIKVNPEGPIENGTDGLDLKINNTLEVDDDWELGVKLDPNSAIDYNAQGLTLNLDETLLVDTGDDGQTKELGVHLNTDGPITADENGLDLETDASLAVHTNNGQGVLGVNPAPTSCLSVTPSGLSLNIDTNSLSVDTSSLAVKLDSASCLTASSGLGLNLDSNSLQTTSAHALAVKVDPSSCITSSTSGLALNINPSTLAIANGQLTALTQEGETIQVDTRTMTNSSGVIGVRLKSGGPIEATAANGIFLLFNNQDFINDLSRGLSLRTTISYLSPYCYATVGDRSLSTLNATLCAENGNKWRGAVYALMVSCSGLVNCSLETKIAQATVGTIGSASSDGAGAVKYTLILNPSGDSSGQHSQLSYTYFPDVAATRTFLSPDISETNMPYVNLSTASWYNGGNATWPGTFVYFTPYGEGTTFSDSLIKYYVGKVRSSSIGVICVSYDSRIGGNWTTGSTMVITTGTLPIQWTASTAPTYMDSTKGRDNKVDDDDE